MQPSPNPEYDNYGKNVFVTPCLEFGINECSHMPPFPIYTQPCIPIDSNDVTRRPLAFGRLALPKLRRELHDKNPRIVWAALTSLCDLCHDPEKAYEAIRLKIIDRLVDLTIRSERETRELVFLLLKILAGYADGKEAIVGNKPLLGRLKNAMDDLEQVVKVKVALCVEEIASFWKTADVLVENGFIELILKKIPTESDYLVVIYFSTLKYLMYEYGKEIALNCGAFRVCTKLLKHSNPCIIAHSCQCLMVLLSTLDGKKLALNDKFFKIINRLLHDERSEIHSNAASVIMFCTTKTISVQIAKRTKGLIERLIKIAQNTSDESSQIYSIKALTNICRHEDVQRNIKENYYNTIIGIQIGNNNSNIQRYKSILLEVINSTPYT